MTKAETTELAKLGANFVNLTDKVDTLGKRVSSHGGKLTKMGNKIFNGYGKTIADMKEAHDQLTRTLGVVIRFGAVALITIFVTLVSILGSIWIQDRASQKEPVRMEVESATDNSSVSAE